MSEPQDEVVVTRSGRLAGCRGRVLVALIALAVLFLLLVVMLVRAMLMPSPPQPGRRAAADVAASLGRVAQSNVILGSARGFAHSSSAIAHTIASARSGLRPGPS